MQNKQKGIVFLLVVIALSILSGLVYQRTNYQYGLDIEGGIRLTYKIKFDQAKEAEQRKNIASIRNNVTRLLLNRVSAALGVVEGNVIAKGDEEFIVELPGYTDLDEAMKTLQSTAKIYAYHAKNVNTALRSTRNYTIGESKQTEQGSPIQYFSDKSGKEIGPKDDKYKAMIAGWDVILEGDELLQAGKEVLGTGGAIPTFKFSSSGAAKMEKWSRTYQFAQENLAFVLDGSVLQIAPLQKNTVLTDSAIIEGTFSPEYLTGLVNMLNAGALPVDLELTSSAKVDPTIGKFALNQIVMAGLISFAIIVLFLLVYYVFPGFVAMLALMLYVLFTLSVLKAIGATFSLASIAGFILSIGMAVDANILVFERVKEEMREGRSLITAVELGFKRAFGAILDSNVCTIITSGVLIIFGQGAVKGFATTLIIGVIISLFTAIVVTRSLLLFFVSSGIGDNPKLYGLGRNWFGEAFEARASTDPLKIMSKSNKWFLISLATIIPGAIFIGMGGIKPNVEFRGGIEAEFKIPAGKSFTGLQITENLEKAGFAAPIVKITQVGPDTVAGVTVDKKPGVNEQSQEFRKELGDATGIGVEPSGISTVGPTIQKETIENAIKAIVFSSLAIILYLAIRFGSAIGGVKNGLKFGFSAIGALLHDILVVVGVAAIVGFALKWQISTLFVTAMLTVIGFSVHDTIVIFDRIRENLRRPQPGETFEHLCDRSISQSFGRSINTASTVIVTLLILIFFGSATIDLKFFCLTMLVGIVSGTYSSIYNAAPILYLWDKLASRNKPENSLMGQAVAENNRLRSVTQVAATAEHATSSYGTVRRRKSAADKARQDLDD